MSGPLSRLARHISSSAICRCWSPSGTSRDLLAAPGRFLDRLLSVEGRGAVVVATMLVWTLLGSALFGAVVGSYRSDRGVVRVAHCAIKVPLALCGTLVLCAPGLVALTRVFAVGLSGRRTLLLAVAANARVAVLLGCLSPVVLVGRQGLNYLHTLLLVLIVCAGAGSAGAFSWVRGLQRAAPRVGWSRLLPLSASSLLLWGAIGGHVSWTLRPFVYGPAAAPIPFARPIEGDWIEAVRAAIAALGSS